MRIGTHLSETVVQDVALGTSPRGQSLRAQQHMRKCASCLAWLIAVEAQLGAARDPSLLRVPERRHPLFAVHDTIDGLIYSRAELSDGEWSARHWGRELNGGRRCATLEEANEYLFQSFVQMFPEHRCTPRCSIEPNPTGHRHDSTLKSFKKGGRIQHPRS